MNESKIKEFLDSWAKGVIEIGKAYSKKEDFEKEALKFLSNHYAFKTQQIPVSYTHLTLPTIRGV